MVTASSLNTISAYGKFHRNTLFSKSGETSTCIIANEKKPLIQLHKIYLIIQWKNFILIFQDECFV